MLSYVCEDKMKQLKNFAFPLSALGLILLLGVKTQAGLLYTYNELTLKNLEQMTQLVRGKITESKKSRSGKVVPLKEGFQAIFSRPDDDGMIEKVAPALRAELVHLKAYEQTVESLVQEALDALTNSKNFKAQAQVTYLLFLENLIAQLRPGIKDESFEKKIIEKISLGAVAPTKEARSERKLRLMREAKSPSEIAKEVLERARNIQPEQKPGPEGGEETQPDSKPEINPK